MRTAVTITKDSRTAVCVSVADTNIT